MDDEAGNELVKLLQIYEQRIIDLESAVVQIADKLEKICAGVDGVVTETRRSNYSTAVGSRGADFEPYREFYGSLTNGRDIIADLVDNMLENKVPDGGIDEYVSNALGTMKSRFGKILGMKDEEATTEEPQGGIEVSIVAESPAEEAKEEPKEEESKDDRPKDHAMDLMSQLVGLRKNGK